MRKCEFELIIYIESGVDNSFNVSNIYHNSGSSPDACLIQIVCLVPILLFKCCNFTDAFKHYIIF